MTPVLRLVLLAIAGAGAAGVMWRLARASFGAPVLQRVNLHDRLVPTGAGVLVPVALACVVGVAAVARPAPDRGVLLAGPALTVALGYGLLGLLDDIAGESADPKGFRGHITALRQGHLTTGGLKLIGGGLVALAAAGQISPGARPASVALAAADIALAANLGNLLDRAPGRTGKAGLVALAGLVVGAMVASSPRYRELNLSLLEAPAIVFGAVAALLPADLGERMMLGDAGANAIGGIAGFGLVTICGAQGRLGAFAALGALNLLSEAVSFSRVIDAVPPLRWWDRLGRLE